LLTLEVYWRIKSRVSRAHFPCDNYWHLSLLNADTDLSVLPFPLLCCHACHRYGDRLFSPRSRLGSRWVDYLSDLESENNYRTSTLVDYVGLDNV